MFNSKQKKIQELERELAIKIVNIAELESERDFCHKKLAEITALKNNTPESCIAGTYCKCCEFVKEYRISKGCFVHKYYVCGKGETCSNFVQKEKYRDDRYES